MCFISTVISREGTAIFAADSFEIYAPEVVTSITECQTQSTASEPGEVTGFAYTLESATDLVVVILDPACTGGADNCDYVLTKE